MDISFWMAFLKLKLDNWKLSTPPCNLKAKISLSNNPKFSSSLIIDADSLSLTFPEESKEEEE